MVGHRCALVGAWRRRIASRLCLFSWMSLPLALLKDKRNHSRDCIFNLTTTQTPAYTRVYNEAVHGFVIVKKIPRRLLRHGSVLSLLTLGIQVVAIWRIINTLPRRITVGAMKKDYFKITNGEGRGN